MSEESESKTKNLARRLEELDRNLDKLLKSRSLPLPPEEASVELQQQQQEGEKEDALVEELYRKHRLFNDRYKDENQHWKEIYKLRNRYIPKLYLLICIWLVFVATCILLTGFGVMNLSDAVLIAFITTTTATVIGIFVIVAKWLFPSSSG